MASKRSEAGRWVPGSLSRRRFLQIGVAATGVGGGGQPFARRAWATTPRRGGILKMAWAGSPVTLDPALLRGGEEWMLVLNIYDNLTRVDEKLQAQPRLATGWKSEDQGRTWIFTLRQGAKFHHGSSVTARDVVFTMERILDPKTGSPGRTALGTVEQVDAVDPQTVRFRLKAPYADLPLTLGSFYFGIVPHDRIDSIATAPSGSGPFRVVEFKPGDRTRLARFPDYWDQGVPYLDELWQVNIPQASTQVATLAGGDVQMMFEVAPPFIPSLSRAPGVSVVEVKSPSYQPIVMRVDQKPFDDNRVRLAMKHAVDRDGLVRAIWQGHGSVAEDHPIAKINPFYAATSPQHTYDLARAKALLTEAGYGQGINVELWTSTERVGLQELAVAVKQMMAPAGINVEIKTVPWSVYIANVFLKKEFYVNNYFGRTSIDETLYPFFRTGGTYNEGRLSNSQLDKLLDEGRSQIDVQQRRKAYAQALQIIHAEGHMVVPYHMNYVTAMRSNVKGYIVHPLKHCDFRWVFLEG